MRTTPTLLLSSPSSKFQKKNFPIGDRSFIVVPGENQIAHLSFTIPTLTTLFTAASFIELWRPLEAIYLFRKTEKKKKKRKKKKGEEE